MTTVSDPSLQNKSQRGFAPLAIARIKGAQRANQIAIYLIYAAILAFMVFGTIASIKAFHNNQLLYQLFYNLPYALVALTIPITIYDALVIYRYRLNQPSMICHEYWCIDGYITWRATICRYCLVRIGMLAWGGVFI